MPEVAPGKPEFPVPASPIATRAMSPGTHVSGRAFIQIGSVGGAARAVAARMARAALPCLTLLGFASPASAQTLVGPDIELRESALVVASAPVLSNGSGTLHIESSTLGELAGGRAVGASDIRPSPSTPP